jgi:iron(III) transport system permease protein
VFPDRSRTTFIAVGLAAFGALSVLPAVYMLAQSLAGPSGVTLDAYAAVVLDARQRQLLFNTLRLGLGAALVAALLGIPLGFALARLPMRAVRVWRVLLAAPLAVPPYILALAWVYIAGSYSLLAAALVLGAGFFPLVMLATEAAGRAVSADVEEAGLIVTTPLRVLRHITLPLMWPLVAASILLVFVLAISEFGVPGLLRVRVFTTEVFTAFAALFDFRRATAVAMPLVVLTAVVATAAVRLAHGGRLAYRSRQSQRAGQGNGLLLQGAHWPSVAVVAAAATIVVTVGFPVAALAREAIGATRGGGLTPGAGRAIVNSVIWSAVAAALATAIGLAVGYWRARLVRRGTVVIDALLVTLFAVPSTVMGIGLIALWNRAALSAVYGTMGMVVVSAVARFTPVAAVLLAGAIRQVPVTTEEIAVIAGAGWLRVLFKVVVPQIWPALAASALVVFVLAFGDVGSTILVAPPGESTLPIRVYTMIANAPASQVARLALVQVAAVLLPLLALVILRNPWRTA